MFRNISHKRKFFMLLLLIMVIGITAYKRSFKGALDAISIYNESQKNVVKDEDLELKLSLLDKKSTVLDNLIGSRTENPNIVQNEILNHISENNFNINLIKLHSLHTFKDDFFTVYSNVITTQGDFNEHLKAINALENNFEHARIASLKLFVIHDRQTKKKELYNEIIFQNYEKNK